LANTINLGADLGAMGNALTLLLGGPQLLNVVIFGMACAILQIFMKYSRYVSVLKWLTLALFAYFGTVMVVEIPWAEVLRGLLLPTVSSDPKFWAMMSRYLERRSAHTYFFCRRLRKPRIRKKNRNASRWWKRQVKAAMP
jgi:Natural resistance-associated macrophage protein-like